MIPLYNLLELGLTERVILCLRRHWFIFFKKVLVFLIEAAIPVLIYIGLVNFLPSILNNQQLVTILFLASGLYYLFIWVALFYNWLNYYLDIWVVTDKQIIDVQADGVFSHSVARQPLYRVQDVLAESKGIWPTLFNFGQIKVQTAGAEEHFIFKDISRPFDVAAKIDNLVKFTPKDVLKK